MKTGGTFLVCIIGIVGFCSFSPESARRAPDFLLVSGDGRKITLGDFVDTPFIIFYESRSSEMDNVELKATLRRHEAGSPISVLAVADCSSASWPFIKAWQDALVKKSQEYGYTVYGDWDGKMREAYGFEKDRACVVLVSGTMDVMYRCTGKMSRAEIDVLMSIIETNFGD